MSIILTILACGVADAANDDNVPRAVLYVGVYSDGVSCDAGCCPDGFDLVGYTRDDNAVCLEQR